MKLPMQLALLLVFCLGVVCTRAEDYRYDVKAIMADMTRQVNDFVTREMEYGKEIFQTTALSPLATNDYQLFTMLGRTYQKVGNIYQAAGNTVEALSALVQCQASHAGKDFMQGQGQRLMDCMAKKAADGVASVQAQRSVCKQCADTVFITSPSALKAAQKFCLSMDVSESDETPMDPRLNAVAALMADANFLSDDESGVVAAIDPAVGTPLPALARVPKFLTPSFNEIDAQMQHGGKKLSFSVKSNAQNFKKDRTHDHVHAEVDIGFVSATVDIDTVKMSQRAANNGVNVAYDAELQTFEVIPPSYFPTSIISTMYNSKGSDAWNTGKSGCKWDNFFGPTGSLQYTVKRIVVGRNIKTNYYVKAGWNEEEHEKLTVDVKVHLWPFTVGVHHEETHDRAANGFMDMEIATSTPAGDNVLFGVILGPIAGLINNVPAQKASRWMQISPVPEMMQALRNLRTLVGPILALSLDHPACGLKLVSCLDEMSPHLPLLQAAARSGDVGPLLRRVDHARLCNCAPCLPERKRATALRALQCRLPEYMETRFRVDNRPAASSSSSTSIQDSESLELEQVAQQWNVRLYSEGECEEIIYGQAFGRRSPSHPSDSAEALRLAHCEAMLRIGSQNPANGARVLDF